METSGADSLPHGYVRRVRADRDGSRILRKRIIGANVMAGLYCGIATPRMLVPIRGNAARRGKYVHM